MTQGANPDLYRMRCRLQFNMEGRMLGPHQHKTDPTKKNILKSSRLRRPIEQSNTQRTSWPQIINFLYHTRNSLPTMKTQMDYSPFIERNKY